MVVRMASPDSKVSAVKGLPITWTATRSANLC
ncbi:unnamed protein product [Nippostrongylus brasiliensis]|uniref:Uncharacterized protein n=1 Tax=Nippostrongylus brasiliensis TaxID=27835 RepID=A0A0N4XNH1_NIPBR|nr:unnamed protein product [Nippostrongylus brasiliensis]